MNNKAQALVEFVLILPIVILLLLILIDVGRIFIEKNELEDNVTDSITVWQHDKTNLTNLKDQIEDNDYEVEIYENKTTNYVTIIVKEDFDFFTPFLNNIINNYQIKLKRVIYYE